MQVFQQKISQENQALSPDSLTLSMAITVQPTAGPGLTAAWLSSLKEEPAHGVLSPGRVVKGVSVGRWFDVLQKVSTQLKTNLSSITKTRADKVRGAAGERVGDCRGAVQPGPGRGGALMCPLPRPRTPFTATSGCSSLWSSRR